MAVWSRVQSLIFGGAIGAAARTAVEPQIEPARQHAWSRNKNRVLDPNTAARLVSQALIELGVAEDEAGRNGFGPDRVNALVQLAFVAPPVAEALQMRRRGEINIDQMRHAFAKAQIEPQYWPALEALLDDRLDPAIIATAIQRGIMRDPGFLPVGPPTTVGKVEAFPVSPLDALDEAKAAGIDEARLFVETAIVGLPLSLQQAASAYFRGIIELPDFQRAVAEGNTRNEWGPAALEQARQILTAGEYSEAELRGYSTATERLANTAKHGMSKADSDLLHLIQGRPLAVHQVTTGLARGGKYGGKYTDVPEPYQDAIRQSNIKEPWAGLAYANRYSYNFPFWWRALVTTGALTPDEAYEILLELGNRPDLARKVTDHFAGTTPGGADKHVAKAETQLWTRTHSSYIADEIDDAAVADALPLAGVAVAAIPDVLARWQKERALIRKQLTPAQVKKAYREAIVNQDTGLPYTRDDALAGLLARGYSTSQANEFLDL